MANSWKIRPATKEDVPSIVWLTQVGPLIADKEDNDGICHCKVLAEFENEPRSMKIGQKGNHLNLSRTITEETPCSYAEMLRDGFGEKQYFHVLVAEWTASVDGPVVSSVPAVDPEKPSTSMPHNDNIVGHALYFYTYSTWEGKCLYMEDLCVREEYRSECRGWGFGTPFCKLDPYFFCTQSIQQGNLHHFPILAVQQCSYKSGS